MVSLKIELGKKNITWVVLLVAVLVVGVVYAYGTSNPAVMGHSAGEIEVDNAFCNKITGHNCGTDTDDQKLSIVGQKLSLTDGGSVSLPGGFFSSVITKTCSSSGQYYASCSAICPTGTTLIGGGCRVDNRWWNIQGNYPSGNSWVCQGHEDYGSVVYNKNIYGYALCAS